MRQPSTPAQRWAWWEAAISGDPPPIYDGEPQAGFFAIRKFSYGKWAKGPFVPARVWWEPGEIDPETGELLSDEKCRAEVDGKPVNPWSSWPWLARRPIPLDEWEFLRAMSPLIARKLPTKSPRPSR